MNCKICNHNQQNNKFQAREMMYGLRDKFDYFQCSNCGCLQIENIPEDISKYYPSDYYSYSKPQQSNAIKQFLIRARDCYCLTGKGRIGHLLNTRARNSLLNLLSHLQMDPAWKILDVGCGIGNLLVSLQNIGFKNLLGVDPFNKRDMTYDNGLKIEKKGIEQVQGKWDLIMFHHVFEHVPDPLNVLRCVAKSLKPDGKCLIRIPIVSSVAWERYGVDWVQLDAPRHFFLHSIKSMTMAAEQCGLEIYNTIWDSTGFQFWGSEQYLKDIPLQDEKSHGVDASKSVFSPDEISKFNLTAQQLNEQKKGDQAAFFLKLNTA